MYWENRGNVDYSQTNGFIIEIYIHVSIKKKESNMITVQNMPVAANNQIELVRGGGALIRNKEGNTVLTITYY